MNAKRNLAHGVVLAAWGLAGALFTFKCLFVTPSVHSLGVSLSFWLWFAGFAAVTTWVASLFEKAWAALLVHGLAFVVLNAVPLVFPLSLTRLGLDLLTGRVS